MKEMLIFAWINLAVLVFSFNYSPIFIMLCFAEEQDLLWRYGDVYADYCKRTGAFWPRKER